MVQPENSSSQASSSSTSNDPKYKGVRQRKWGKWVSEIRLPNSRERIWLGSYDTPEKAARAFDAALYCLRGGSASFNFPDNPPQIPGGQSLAPEEIQVVAARYANNYEMQIQTNVTIESVGASNNHNLDPQQISHVKNMENTFSATSSSCHVVDDVDSTSRSAMDWSFLSTLESNEGTVNPDFGVFNGIDNLGCDYFPTPISPHIDDFDYNNSYGTYVGGDDNVEPYTQHSFLWNF